MAVGAVARFRCAPGAEDKVAEILTRLRGDVRKEPGNLVYDIYRSRADPSAIVVLERYRDREAVRTHAGAAYVQAFGEAVRPLLQSDIEVEILQGVGDE
ncbi:MAG: antibiotic biosynthesis monooxygenase [Caulobacteraceae bacterium]|nr:antibiotic biosynthesis monooxygenase [Caulobacteraceae bacterium]